MLFVLHVHQMKMILSNLAEIEYHVELNLKIRQFPETAEIILTAKNLINHNQTKQFIHSETGIQ